MVHIIKILMEICTGDAVIIQNIQRGQSNLEDDSGLGNPLGEWELPSRETSVR